jgi:RimJ/RimL family protein N-acetyltransferase
MTVRVILRPWTDADDAATLRWLADPFIRDTFGITSAPTLDGHRRWKAAQTTLSAFAIEAEGRHVGNALLHREPRHRSAYLQIYLGEAAARGRGIGREALAALLAIGFTELGLHRIWLHTLPGNVAAETLYRAAGFVSEGVERDATLTPEGFRSQTRWALLAPDWRARRDMPP